MKSSIAIFSRYPDSLERLTIALEDTELYQVESFSQWGELVDWCRAQSRSVTAFFLEEASTEDLMVLKKISSAENAIVFDITPKEKTPASNIATNLEGFFDSLVVKPLVDSNFEDKVNSLVKNRNGLKMTALVVDETNCQRELLCKALSRCGFLTFLETIDARTAVEVLGEKLDSIALFVLCAEPPSQESLQSLMEIKRSHRLSKVPFLIVTSHESLVLFREREMARQWMSRSFPLPLRDELLRIQVSGLEEPVLGRSRLHAFLAEADVFIKRSEIRHAIDILEHAIKLKLDDPLLMEKLGDLYTQDIETPRHLEKAIAIYQQNFKRYPNVRSSVLKCGDLLYRLERSEDLISLYRQFLMLWPFESSVRLQLAKSFMKKGDYGAASVELRRLLSLEPENVEANLLLHTARALQAPSLLTKKQVNAAS